MQPIQTVGIIDAGQVDIGIAQVFTISGFKVGLCVVSIDVLNAALARTGKNGERQVTAGQRTKYGRETALSRTSSVSELGELCRSN